MSRTFQKLVNMQRNMEKMGFVKTPKPQDPMFTREARNLKAKIAVESTKRDKPSYHNDRSKKK